MSTGGSAPVTTQVANTTPWANAQPFLMDIYSRQQDMANRGAGYLPYTGPTVAGLDPTLAQGLQTQAGIANWQENAQFTAGQPLNAAYNNAANVIANQGLSGGTQGQLANMQNDITGMWNPINQYQQLFSQNAGQQNPYLQAQIDAANRAATDKVNSAMSASGRYGSGLYQDAMARAQAEVADPILAQDYTNRQQLAMAANQGLGQALGQQFQAQQNMANVYQQGLGLAGQYSQAVPGILNAFYAPGQMMQSAGEYLQGRAQQDLAGQIQEYNAQQAWPWQQIERQAAIMAGAGTLGGQEVSTSSTQVPLTQRLLGGALAGGGLGSAFGMPGIGALGGGLAGAFL